MKVQAVIAIMAIVTAIGVTQPQAGERVAKLYDPAMTTSPMADSVAVAPLGAVEKTSLPYVVTRTGLSSIEQLGIRTSIRSHMQALSARDATGVYESLTPIVKDFYSNSKSFLDYLTTQLKPLANARNFAFASIEREATDAVQEVVLIGKEGREWIARFKLQRQPDGRWAIAQCLIEAAPGPQT